MKNSRKPCGPTSPSRPFSDLEPGAAVPYVRALARRFQRYQQPMGARAASKHLLARPCTRCAQPVLAPTGAARTLPSRRTRTRLMISWEAENPRSDGECIAPCAVRRLAHFAACSAALGGRSPHAFLQPAVDAGCMGESEQLVTYSGLGGGSRANHMATAATADNPLRLQADATSDR
ncbi:hypothetical protein RJ55_02825 [Drechmeria coniospora]|nr:hypothetical protein RJ55_02825 [Drechmeria coniospora]